MGVRTKVFHNPLPVVFASEAGIQDRLRLFRRVIELTSRQQQTERTLLDWPRSKKLKY